MTVEVAATYGISDLESSLIPPTAEKLKGKLGCLTLLDSDAFRLFPSPPETPASNAHRSTKWHSDFGFLQK